MIAALVAEVTDNPSLDSAERKRTQEREAPSKSPSAKLIRLADKTCNVRDITHRPPSHWPESRRAEYFAWAQRVVAGMRGTNAALEESFDASIVTALASVVTAPQALATMQ